MSTLDERLQAQRLFFATPEPTVAQVRDVTERFFDDMGHGMRWEVTWWVSEQFKDKRKRTTNFNGGLATRFCGQVVRALDAMAADGKLVKVPDEGSHREAGYYTPAYREEVLAEAARQRAERDGIAARWVAVHRVLEALGDELGFAVYSRGGVPAELGLEGWETLIRRKLS